MSHDLGVRVRTPEQLSLDVDEMRPEATVVRDWSYWVPWAQQTWTITGGVWEHWAGRPRQVETIKAAALN